MDPYLGCVCHATFRVSEAVAKHDYLLCPRCGRPHPTPRRARPESAAALARRAKLRRELEQGRLF